MNKKHKIWQSHIPAQPLGASVVKGDIGFAIRFWKRALKDAGTLQELRERRYFKKKSSKRREQLDSAKYFQKINSQQD
jgi:ribosomal protein S21|tara:strand:+ start:169 stop:402 length:234 start_codon:yes stop_codon:yes gene_type:complete